jgi:diguanylate cyclase (GGDEF)-like protein
VLEKSLKSVRGTSRLIAFAFLDIDDFKKVNDTHGHDVGDALLKAFANRMRQALGDEGIVARLAGDEFAVVMDRVDSAEDLHSDLVSLMEEMRRPFSDVSVPVTVTCSAGVAICAGGVPVTEVLRTADKAMYRAKHDGKNRFNVVHI